MRQFWPATISRAGDGGERQQKADVDDRRGDAAEQAENKIATRPASHSSASAASGQPLTGSRPVQFGMAVSRKPATVAAT